MKIYIMTDMEGASGIGRGDKGLCDSGKPAYVMGQKLLTADVNAAIEGALEGGAVEIVVNAGHGGGDSILPDVLHSAALLESPVGGQEGAVMPSLDSSFDGLFIVGSHAMAGTPNAFLDHTQSGSSWYNYFLNGKKYGEIGQFAIIAGHYGVPLVLVTGDRAAVREARSLVGSGLQGVEVKKAFSRNVAVCLSPTVAHRNIRSAAKQAMRLTRKMVPLKIRRPIKITLECQRTEVADWFVSKGCVTRVDGRTVSRVVRNQAAILDF